MIEVLTYTLTAIFWGRWQAQIHVATLPHGGLDPMYLRSMGTNWVRGAMIAISGLATFWMVVQHLSSEAERLR